VTPAFLLQVAAIAVGGGSVQLAIFLLKRRAELRSLDAASDATLLNSANAYIVTLQAGDKILRAEVESLKKEILVLKQAWADERQVMREEWDGERISNTEAMESANRMVTRCRLDLAAVRADLLVAQAQIAELAARLLPVPRALGDGDKE
jgi:hypothetical protein